MEILSALLNLTSISSDRSRPIALITDPLKLSSFRRPRRSRLECPNVNQDNDEYNNDRYPCLNRVISDHLACGTRRNPPNLYSGQSSVQHRRSVTTLVPERRATTILLIILPSATHNFISRPTLIPAVTVSSSAKPAAATKVSTALTPPVLQAEAEKVGLYDAPNMSASDLLLNPSKVKSGFVLLILLLVFLMLVVLAWRELQVWRAEERAVSRCAALAGGTPEKWRKLISAKKYTELRSELELRLEKRSRESESRSWERNPQFSQPLASPFL